MVGHSMSADLVKLQTELGANHTYREGQQHMRWSREGLDPLLQLRSAIGSNDWDKIWKTAVMNAISAQ